MQIDLTEPQRQLRDAVQAFAREKLRPAAAGTDRAARFPRERLAELGRLGVLGCFVPEEFGGAGFDWVASAVAVEELSAACAATGGAVAAHMTLAVWPVLAFGNDEQRRRHLPRLVSGESVGCLVLPEPGPEEAGGPGGLVARRDGDHYVLDGGAPLVRNAPVAEVAVVVAALDGRGQRPGHAAFVVATAAPGWEVGPVAETAGVRGAHAARVVLRGVRVPSGSRLGADGDGGAIAERTCDGARIGLAAQAVGIARAAFEAALAYVQDRRAFGQRLADFQNTQFRLADMAVRIDAARLLALQAAARRDRGLPHASQAAMAKLYAAETATAVATQAVQLHGGYGFTREFAVERCFRDAKSTEIFDGTAEALRGMIADRMLGEGNGA